MYGGSMTSTLSGNAGPAGSLRYRTYMDYERLVQERSSWLSHWRILTDYVLPRRGRYLLESPTDKGKTRNNKIIDNTGTLSVRTLCSGMMTGMTSPARPWFRMRLLDEQLMDRHDVRDYLSVVERVLRALLNRSNFYNAVYNVYRELAVFGSAPTHRLLQPGGDIRYRPFTAGEYVMAEAPFGTIGTIGRLTNHMTVRQVVGRFLVQPGGRDIDWTRGSTALKNCWDKGDYRARVPVLHMVDQRMEHERKPGSLRGEDRAFASIFMEVHGDGDQLLEVSGYDRFPCYVPRWDVVEGDVYGMSPAMDALGDIRQLQKQQLRKAQSIDKAVSPPMRGPTSMKGRAASSLPGSMTYVDPVQSANYEPAYTVKPFIGELVEDMREVQARIRMALYADLFAMMINSDRRQITATEVAERHEEKLMLLGPVLQRLNVELLDPLIGDLFMYALEEQLIPPAPEVLRGQPWAVKYIGLLAQAQEAVSASAMERFMGFAGNLVGVFPGITQNIDADEAIHEYGDIVGVPPGVLRDPKIVAAERAQQAQEAAAIAASEKAAVDAQTAKVLSETDTQTPNALGELLKGGGY